MEAKGVGISAASKILALMNPVDLGIYDSRNGPSLRPDYLSSRE